MKMRHYFLKLVKYLKENIENYFKITADFYLAYNQ